MTFSAGDIEATLRLKRDDFTQELNQAKADADEFTRRPYEAKITADGKQARDTFDDLLARKDALTKKTAAVKVKADVAEAGTDLDKTGVKADDLGKKTPTVKVKADTTAADVELDKTALKADALGRKNPKIKVDADTSAATKKVDDLSTKITNFSNKMKEGTPGPAWLGGAIATLPAATNLLGAAAGAVAGLGGSFVTAGAAAGAFAAVAKPVLTQAMTASKAAGTAQDAYTIAVQKTTGQYQAAMSIATTQAQRTAAYAAEQKGFAADRLAETAAQSKAYAGMSTAQIDLSKQIGTMAAAWKAVKAAETPLVAGALQPWLKTVTSLTSGLAPIITQVAPVIKDLGTKMNDVVTSAGWKGFISFVAGTGSTGIRSIGSTMIDLIDSFILLLPKFKPLIDLANAGIANFGAKVLAWAQSQKAANDITAFIGWFTKNGPTVWGLIVNLGKAIAALSPGLTAGGLLEIRLLSDFFGWIAKLPKGFAGPIEEVVGALLLASKLGVIGIGVKIYGISSKILNWLNGGGSLSLGAGGMQTAADTMVTAAARMQTAADTMTGGAGSAGAAAEGEAIGGGLGRTLIKGGILVAMAAAIVELGIKPALQGQPSGTQNDSTQPGNWWDNPAHANPTDTRTAGQGASTWAGLGTMIKGWFGFGQSTPDRPAPGSGPRTPQSTSPNIGEMNWTKWWQDFDRDVVHKVTDWVTVSLPHTFTSVIPRLWDTGYQWFTNKIGSPVAAWFTQSLPHVFTNVIPRLWDGAYQWFMRSIGSPVANWVTVSLPHAFTTSIPRWFSEVWARFTSGVVTPVSRFITTTLPGFFTSTIPRWFSSAWGSFTGGVVTPVSRFVTTTLPGFFTSTIPRWFSTVVSSFTSNVINPVRTFITSTLPGFFTSTIPHWFSTTVASFTGNVISPLRAFITTTLPGFFTSTIPGWFKSAGTWFTADVITPVTNFITSIPGKIASGFRAGINTVIGFVDTILSAVKLPTIPQLAQGGMVPGGYSPVDNQLAWLRSGEGVLQPGAVSALGGPGFIDWANRSYGDVPVGSSPAGHYAAGGIPGGGVLHNVTHAVTDVASSVLGDVTGLLKTGFKFAFDHLWSATVSPALGIVSAAPAGNIVAGVAGEMKQHFDDVLGAKDAAVKAAAAIGMGGVANSSAEAALKSAAAKAGWTGAQWQALYNVEMREAGFSLTAQNQSSGAYGMAQFINGPGEYAQYGGNSSTAAGQAVAMVNYIAQRYGNPAAAWAHEQSAGWYASGGLINMGTGPRADDVLIRVSRGETVVSADHSKVLAPAFSAIGVPGYAGGGIPGGILPGYASGGLIPSSLTDELAARYLAAWIARKGGGYGAAWGPAGIGQHITGMRAAYSHDSLLAGAVGLSAANHARYRNAAAADKAKLSVLDRELADLRTYRSDLAVSSGKLGQWIRAAGSAKSLAANVRAWKAAQNWEASMMAKINSAVSGPAGATPAQQASTASAATSRTATAFLSAWKNRKGGGYDAAWGPVVISKQIDAANAAYRTNSTLAGAGGLTATVRARYSKAAANDKAKLAVLDRELKVMSQYRTDLGSESSAIGKWISAAGSSAALAGNVKTWKATKGWDDWQAGQVSAAIGLSAAQDAAKAAAATASAATSASSTAVTAPTGTAPATLVPGVYIDVPAVLSALSGTGTGSTAGTGSTGGTGGWQGTGSTGSLAETLIDELRRKLGQGILDILNRAGGGGLSGQDTASLSALTGGGFDRGGWLQPGATMAVNNTGRPEPVLSPDQWDSLSGAMAGGGGIGDKLDRIANLLAAQPRAIGSGVGEVLNGAARSASLRARFPRN